MQVIGQATDIRAHNNVVWVLGTGGEFWTALTDPVDSNGHGIALVSIADEHRPAIVLALVSDSESYDIAPDWGSPLAQGIPLDVSGGELHLADTYFEADHEYHVPPGQYLADVHRQGADQLQEMHWNGLVDDDTHGIEKWLVTLRFQSS